MLTPAATKIDRFDCPALDNWQLAFAYMNWQSCVGSGDACHHAPREHKDLHVTGVDPGHQVGQIKNEHKI